MTPETVNGAAPAAEQPPPSAEASEPTAKPTGGAAPLSLEELRAIPEGERTARQKRRLSLLEKAAAAEARRAKRAAKAAAAAPAPAKEKPDADEDDDRDDAQRARETGGAWRLTLRIVSLILWPFGWRLEPLTDKECAEDVQLLAPLARRHRWLDMLIRYAALPYLLVERVVSKAKRREAEQPPPAGKGAKA